MKFYSYRYKLTRPTILNTPFVKLILPGNYKKILALGLNTNFENNALNYLKQNQLV